MKQVRHTMSKPGNQNLLKDTTFHTEPGLNILSISSNTAPLTPAPKMFKEKTGITKVAN